MRQSQSSKEADLAKAKQFYYDQMAKRGTPVNAITHHLSRSRKEIDPLQTAAKKKKSSHTRQGEPAVIRQNSCTIRQINISSGKQYYNAELMRMVNQTNAVLERNGSPVDKHKSFDDFDEALPLLVSNECHNCRTTTEQLAVHPRVRTVAKTSIRTQSFNEPPTMKAAAYVTNLLKRGTLLLIWTVGVIFSVLVLRFEKPSRVASAIQADCLVGERALCFLGVEDEVLQWNGVPLACRSQKYEQRPDEQTCE